MVREQILVDIRVLNAACLFPEQLLWIFIIFFPNSINRFFMAIIKFFVDNK